MGGGPSSSRKSSPASGKRSPTSGRSSPTSPYSEFADILDDEDMQLSRSPSSNNTLRRKRSAIEEIRYQSEQTANRAADKRAEDKKSKEWYPGMPQQPLKKRDQMLQSISVKTPFVVQTTTNAITVKWAPEQSGGAARIKRYDLQMRIDTKDDTDMRVVGAWVENITYDADAPDIMLKSKEHYETGNRWSSVPESVVKGLKLEATICGLPADSAPLKFRVRGRCNAGWGPWSGISAATRTLRNDIPAPLATSPTSSSFEMKWKSLKDARYGKIKAYILMGKTEHEEDTWKECYTGVQPKILVNRVGKNGLTPKTMYMFKVVTISSHGNEPNRDESELLSGILQVETLGAVPDVPRPPKVISVSHESITVRWTPPCSNGSPITMFHLVGKVGNSQVYYEWYNGTQTKHTVGIARSTNMNVSTTKITGLTEYNLKIAASNGFGTSSFSSPIMIITEPPPDQPDRPDPPRPTFSELNSSEPNSPELGSANNSTGTTSTDATSPRTFNTSNESKQNSGGFNETRRSSHRSSPQARRLAMLSNKNVREIEEGWLECWEEQQKAFYYFHPDSGSTQWDHPSKSKVDADLVFRRKRFKFLYLLHQNMREEQLESSSNNNSLASPERQPVLPLTINRKQLVYTSYTQLRAEATDPMVLMRTPKITFVGEEGIDSGGVSKDWFLCLSRAFSDPQLCLFRTCNDGGETLCLVEPRSSINTEHLEYFRFVGRIIGMAIFHRHLVDLKFPNWMYKQLMGQQVELDDLMETDPQFCTSLKWLINNKLQPNPDEDPIVEFDFTVTQEGFGTTKTIELIPDGKTIQVTDDNKDLYVSLQLQWKINGSISDQIRCLKQGFSEIIPEDHVMVFQPKELLLLLNGKSIVLAEEMRLASRYTGGYEADSSSIVLFWQAFETMTQAERRMILKFATGASRVPLDGFDPTFTITKSEYNKDALPTSHTCFNQLVLPPYENIEMLKEKVLMAVENTEGFQMT